MIIELTERVARTVWDEVYCFSYVDRDYYSYIIDTDKIDAHLADPDSALHHYIGYVQDILNEARNTGVVKHHGHKCSFTDTPEWFECILADEGAKIDRVCEYDVG